MLHYRDDETPHSCPKKSGIGFIMVYHTFTDSDRNRKGSEKEEGYLIKLFEEWSLEIHKYPDLTRAELEKLLSSLSGRSDNDVFPTLEERHKILVIVISSHGGEDYILTSDMERITYFEIMSYLNEILNIPKLIIFNNCRKSPRRAQQAWTEDILPQDSMILLLCQKGTASFRSTEEGSFCLKELYKAYVSYGRKMDLQSFLEKFICEVEHTILEVTREKGKPCTQQPILRSTMKKLFYFPQIVSSDKISPAPAPQIEMELLSVPKRIIGTSGEEDMEREEPGGLDIGRN